MKKILLSTFVFTAFVFVSCGSSSDTPPKNTDTTVSSGPDSAANNGILPPSAAPGNAGNSSLADTTYKSKDTLKK
jgi:hypothetical protein